VDGVGTGEAETRLAAVVRRGAPCLVFWRLHEAFPSKRAAKRCVVAVGAAVWRVDKEVRLKGGGAAAGLVVVAGVGTAEGRGAMSEEDNPKL
jgi:hypothetical protein